MKKTILLNLGISAFLILLSCTSILAQHNSYNFQSCSSGSCVTSSQITLHNVLPGVELGDPARVLAGETFEVCYEVTGWNYINMNWFHGAEPTVGAGLVDPSQFSIVTTSQGVNQNWIWSSYCIVNCCDALGDNTSSVPNVVCGPPNPGSWLFAVDSGINVCQGGSALDGEVSNNRGDSGSAGFEFCIELETDCGPVTEDIISSNIGWNVYSDSDMGTWGYGQASNFCGCEGGAEECSIDIQIVCCDPPDVNGWGPEENVIFVNGFTNITCTSDANSLSIEGDIGNPDYEYQWEGPAGFGPDSPVWDANSFPSLPIPPPAGVYNLTVLNTASGDCTIGFSVELLDDGLNNLISGSALVCAGSGDVIEIPANASSFGGPACNLPGVECLTATHPNNPNGQATIFIDPKQLGPGHVGIHDIFAIAGQTGSSCFGIDTGAYIEVLYAPIQPLIISPGDFELCTSLPIDAQLPPNISILNPSPGSNYAWSFSPVYSTDAIVGTGLSIDVSSLFQFYPDLSGVDQNTAGDLIQALYAFPISVSSGCVGFPSVVEFTFEVCDCAPPSITQAGTSIDICENPQFEVANIINDISQQTIGTPGGTSFLRLNYNGVNYFKSNTPNSITGGTVFQTFTDLENVIFNNSQANPCQLLQAQISISSFCVPDNGASLVGPTNFAPLTLNIYPDLPSALGNTACSTTSLLNTPCASASSLCIFNATVGIWSNPNNWSGNVLPSQACHVFILNNSNCFVLPGTNAQCQTLTVDPSSQLNMDDTSCIEAFGN